MRYGKAELQQSAGIVVNVAGIHLEVGPILRGGNGQAVAALVAGDAGMALYPNKLHGVLAVLAQELAPQVGVLLVLKPGLLPGKYPAFIHGIHHVLGVRVNGYVAAVKLEGL